MGRGNFFLVFEWKKALNSNKRMAEYATEREAPGWAPCETFSPLHTDPHDICITQLRGTKQFPHVIVDSPNTRKLPIIKHQASNFLCVPYIPVACRAA
jgi:hypothetical protein